MNSSKADVDDKERKKNLRSADGSVNYLMFFNHYVQNITCNIIKLPSAAETLTTISPHLLIQRSLFFGLSRKKRRGTKGCLLYYYSRSTTWHYHGNQKKPTAFKHLEISEVGMSDINFSANIVQTLNVRFQYINRY